MAHWKKHFAKYASVIDDAFDELALNFRKRLGSFRPLHIVPYRSYGTARRVYIKGRVLENRNIASATDKDTILNNLVNMYRRFQSDEVGGALLQAKVGDEVLQVTTDKEGYFVLDIHPKEPIITDSLWHGIPIELLNAPIPHEKDITSIAEVMIPPPDAEYGIISDIDDTIVRTSATDLLAMSRTTFLNNARTRLPFAGVAEFYRSLQLGRNGKRNNPFFYVSSSPWNLYDLLTDFLDLNKIPAGPLLLRDFGLQGESVAGGGHMGHKFNEIEQIMNAYPHLNFVLIGDSGQEDPVIYREVVKKFPDRVLAIYIRDVQLAEREQIAVEVSRSLYDYKVEMMIVDNTVEAAEHAAKTGLIFTEAIPAIEEEKKEDKGEKAGKEDASIL